MDRSLVGRLTAERTAHLWVLLWLSAWAAAWLYRAARYGDLPFMPTDWFDIPHYLAIAAEGYSRPWLPAFFPAWPVLLAGASAVPWVGSVLQWLLAPALGWLGVRTMVARGWAPPHVALVAGLFPPMVFLTLPYSEALFGGAVLLGLYGLDRRHLFTVAVALVVLTLTRPTAAVWAVALGLAWLSASPRHMRTWFETAGLAGVAILSLLAAFALQTALGAPFGGFFEAQQGWGNTWQLPTLPLHTWGGDRIVLLDGIALWTGLLAAWSLVACRLTPVARSAAIALILTVLLILFSRGGGVFSLNRFIFAGWAVPIWWAAILRAPQLAHIRFALMALVLAVASAAALGAFVHIRGVLHFALAMGLVAAMHGSLRRWPDRSGWWLVACWALAVWTLAERVMAGRWIA